MLLNCGVGEDSWESLGLQADPTSPFWRSALGVLWKDWCYSWNANILANWCKEMTHLKRPWCWERLRARGEGEDRGWDGWMASLTQLTWVWASCDRWWRTGKPGVLQSIGSQNVRHNLVNNNKETRHKRINPSVENCEGSEMLLNVSAYKFQAGWQKTQTLGSQTKDFVTNSDRNT